MDRAAFDLWLEEHYPQLVRVARRRVNTDDAAEDAVQTAVATLLASPTFQSSPPEFVWPRAVKAVTRAAWVLRRTATRLAAHRQAEKVLVRAGGLHGWKRPATRAE